jgi:AraC-like DNA-binding protein
MTAYNFKAQFADDVESGRKKMTIRARRKDGHIPRSGGNLQLYYGMRTKQCRKLRDAICEFTQEVRMTDAGMKVNGVALHPNRILQIAKADGFDSIESFREFFRKEHGFPFLGDLITWE